MGVIGTLTAGFETVNRRLWLLLFPIGLDLLLWCGPQISIAPIVRRVAAVWITSPATGSYDQQQIVALRQGFEGLARSSNLLALLSLTAPSRDVAVRLFTFVFANILGVPALVTNRDETTAAAPIQVPTIELSEPWALVVTATVLLLLGVLLSALFLSLIAQIVRDDEVRVPALLRCVGPNAVHIATYLVLGCVLVTLVSIPILAFATPLLLNDPALGTFLVITPWLWLGFYLFFAPGAMLVNEVHPARAVWYSFNIMRLYPWRAMGLIVSMIVIQGGLPMLWQQIMAWPWGVPIGIVGNAYVSTGLTVTCMIFYQDRYRQWREMVMAAGPR